MEYGNERKIYYSEKFLKSTSKLPRKIQTLAGEREKIFLANPFDQRLKTHKLHGKDKTHWAYWVDNKIRIKFLFLNNGDVAYLNIGTHDEVY